MINKRSLWFLTLFSLILVLSIYYITMPSELLLTTNKNTTDKVEKEVNVEVKESNLLVALRVESDSEMSKEIDISYEYVRHIVSPGGQKALSFYSMYKIAKVLGVKMDDICEGIFDDKK